jgi:hypothetical protein
MSRISLPTTCLRLIAHDQYENEGVFVGSCERLL